MPLIEQFRLARGDSTLDFVPRRPLTRWAHLGGRSEKPQRGGYIALP